MIFDISLTIREQMAVWPGSDPVKMQFTEHFVQGDDAVVTHLSMGAHTGTHLDAPLHFVEEGKTVDTLDLEKLVGPAYVVNALGADTITAAVLENLPIPQGAIRLLIRTSNSDWWAAGDYSDFHKDYVALENDAAQWLVDHGMVTVGVDYLSVAPFERPIETHRTLLSNDVIAVEGLNLFGIEQGHYQLVCLPLKLGGREGAPCRAILTR